MSSDRHTFEADESGISCVRCGLPDANVRHQTAARVVEALTATATHQEAVVKAARETLLEVNRDLLYWSIAGQAEADGLVTVLPVWLYLAINVTYVGDHGQAWPHASIDRIWGMNTELLYDEFDDGGLVNDIFGPYGMDLEPDDFKTYYFKVKANAERSRHRSYLSMDYIEVEGGTSERTEETLIIDGLTVSTEVVQPTTDVGSSGTLAD